MVGLNKGSFLTEYDDLSSKPKGSKGDILSYVSTLEHPSATPRDHLSSLLYLE